MTLTPSDRNCDDDVDPERHCHVDGHPNCVVDGYRYQHADADCDSNGHRNGDEYVDAFRHGNIDGIKHADTV